jgi:hypothetical protein
MDCRPQRLMASLLARRFDFYAVRFVATAKQYRAT